MGYLTRSVLPAVSRKVTVSFIDQDGWIFASLFFLVFMDRDVVKNAPKNVLGQYAAFLTSLLVNNLYVLSPGTRPGYQFKKKMYILED